MNKTKNTAILLVLLGAQVYSGKNPASSGGDVDTPGRLIAAGPSLAETPGKNPVPSAGGEAAVHAETALAVGPKSIAEQHKIRCVDLEKFHGIDADHPFFQDLLQAVIANVGMPPAEVKGARMRLLLRFNQALPYPKMAPGPAFQDHVSKIGMALFGVSPRKPAFYVGSGRDSSRPVIFALFAEDGKSAERYTPKIGLERFDAYVLCIGMAEDSLQFYLEYREQKQMKQSEQAESALETGKEADK